MFRTESRRTLQVRMVSKPAKSMFGMEAIRRRQHNANLKICFERVDIPTTFNNHSECPFASAPGSLDAADTDEDVMDEL